MPDHLIVELKGDKTNPFHKSVGMIVVNKDGDIALIRKSTGTITLPRETQYLQESPIACLSRGAKEELGLTINIGRYLGSLSSSFIREDGTRVEKNTDYFQAKSVNKTISKKTFTELTDTVIWVSLSEALKILLKQGAVEGVNESLILKRYKNHP